MRAAVFLAPTGQLDSFTREAFALYWEEGGAPPGTGEEDENGPISEAARRVGADPEEVLEGASAAETKRALRDATEEAIGRGVFGAPAFFVGGEMFWGNDRLHFVEAALKGLTEATPSSVAPFLAGLGWFRLAGIAPGGEIIGGKGIGWGPVPLRE